MARETSVCRIFASLFSDAIFFLRCYLFSPMLSLWAHPRKRIAIAIAIRPWNAGAEAAMNPWDQPGFGLDVESSTAAKDDEPPIPAQFLPVRNHGLRAISRLESQQGLLPPQTCPRKPIAIERHPPTTATPGRLDGEDGPLPSVESLTPTQAAGCKPCALAVDSRVRFHWGRRLFRLPQPAP